MRSVFYVAVAVAVLARSSVVAAFTNADESQLLSKTTPDFAADAMISSDSRKRFLRVTDSEDGELMAADEERVKTRRIDAIIKQLEADKEMKHVAEILENVEFIHAINKLNEAKQSGKIKKAEYEAAKALIEMSN